MNQSELTLKNLKPIIFIVIVLVLTAITVYPQRKFAGQVVEVVDGKTCVIQLGSGRVTAVLQYIDVPEPEQQMHQTVRNHLAGLVLDKMVEFKPRIVMKDRTVGQLMVKGVDISQQMLRDGAAWYSIPEKSGQDEAEGLVYQDNETRAKTEKRGVWGVENLKPSWEFRAEQAALKRKQEQEASRNAAFAREMENLKKSLSQSEKQNTGQIEMWADVGGASRYDEPIGFGGLRGGYDPALRIGHVSTPSVYLDFPGAGFLQKVDARLFYLYRGSKTNIEDSIYAVGFITTSKDFRFRQSNNLTITADSQKLAFGKARLYYRQGQTSVKELLVYKMTRAQLMKIVKAQKIGVQIGPYKGGLSTDSLTLINNLLDAS